MKLLLVNAVLGRAHQTKAVGRQNRREQFQRRDGGVVQPPETKDVTHNQEDYSRRHRRRFSRAVNLAGQDGVRKHAQDLASNSAQERDMLQAGDTRGMSIRTICFKAVSYVLMKINGAFRKLGQLLQ
jgi:hypothetical protein